MRLIPYTDRDLALAEALESAPAVMGHLGGPMGHDHIVDTHQRRLAGIATGDRYYVVVPAGTDSPAGIAGLWDTEWEGRIIREVGVMLLPEFQHQGIAPRALRALFPIALAEDRVSELHIFAAVSNVGVHAAAPRLGFLPLGEHEMDHAGRPLRCRHWVVRLAQPY
jgi:RimJ/RimL family protein N-acetyltransferase